MSISYHPAKLSKPFVFLSIYLAFLHVAGFVNARPMRNWHPSWGNQYIEGDRGAGDALEYPRSGPPYPQNSGLGSTDERSPSATPSPPDSPRARQRNAQNLRNQNDLSLELTLSRPYDQQHPQVNHGNVRNANAYSSAHHGTLWAERPDYHQLGLSPIDSVPVKRPTAQRVQSYMPIRGSSNSQSEQIDGRNSRRPMFRVQPLQIHQRASPDSLHASQNGRFTHGERSEFDYYQPTRIGEQPMPQRQPPPNFPFHIPTPDDNMAYDSQPDTAWSTSNGGGRRS